MPAAAPRAWRGWGLLLAALTLSAIHGARGAEPEPLTLARIFEGDEFEPQGVGPFQWCRDGGGYTSLEKAADGGAGRDVVRHDPATGATEVLVPAHRLVPERGGAPLAIDAYTVSDDGSRVLLYTNSKQVWRTRSRGDYWVYDLTSRALKRLGGDAPPASLMFATFAPDGRRVAYVRDHNLYVQDVGDLRITALTTDGSATLINGTFDWVYEEELDLRRGFVWSPDSRSLAYWQLDVEGVPEFHLINNTDALYPTLIPIRYPKAGERNAAARIGVVPADGGATRWLDLPGDPREHYPARLDWTRAPQQVAVQQFNRLQNTNRVFLADADTGAVRLLLTETDAAWVENENAFRWTPDPAQLLWLSEREGWKHLYRVDRTNGRTRRLTDGGYDVLGLEAAPEGSRWVYFTASPDNPTQRYLYRVPWRGGKARRVTPADEPGSHSYQISPDGRWAIQTWSTFGQPPVTTLVRLPGHETVRVLADNAALREKLAALPPGATEFFRVDIGDGIELDAWCLRPPDFDPAGRYPVLFYVYGEPGGQTVLDRWGGKTHLWHRLLAQRGYVVISVDNRGTPAPRGRAWRKCIYRQVGILAPADQAAAVRAILARWPYLDAGRVAVWGWSGGGSMTLNALFRYPDLYQAGMAVAPVPVQRYYDTIYQERYMGLPDDNAEGYRLGSPITHARQLRGHLLLVHGTGDDNCHYQGTEALIDELVAHNQPFTLMAYPNRSHSLAEGRNTTRHLYELLTRYLTTHVPPGP